MTTRNPIFGLLVLTLLALMSEGCSSLKTADTRALDRSERQHELEQVVDSQPTAQGLRIELPTEEVFTLDSSKFRPQVRKNLGELAELLAKYPHDRVRIVDGAVNPDLAARRAEALDRYFQSLGVRNSISTRAVAAQERPIEIFIDFPAEPLAQPRPTLANAH